MALLPVRAGSGKTVWALVDEEDLPMLRQRSWRLDNRGYVVTRVYAGKRNGKSRQRDAALARLLLGLRLGDLRQADHINRDPLDNRRSNLRVVTPQEQAQNKSPYQPRAKRAASRHSRHRGVHWNQTNGKWKASGRLNGRPFSLGYFDDEEEAASVVADWRRQNMSHAVN